MIRISLLIICMFLVACSGPQVKVEPVKQKLSAVCIVNNTKVIVPGFENLILASLVNKGIQVKEVSRNDKKQYPQCDYIISYDARRTWSWITILVDAEVSVYDEKTQKEIGSFNFHQDNNFNFAKYSSTQTKIQPILDKMFIHQ